MRFKAGILYKVFMAAIFMLLLFLVMLIFTLSAGFKGKHLDPVVLYIPCGESALGNPSENIEMPKFLIPLFEAAEKPVSVLKSGSSIVWTEPDKEDIVTPTEGTVEYDFTKPVPETPEVDDSYFEDALFIGDSRTVGLMNYSGVKSYYYAKVALTIRGVLSNAFIEDSNSKSESGDPVMRTIMETVKLYPQFKKLYISFGLNELGWDSNVFINTYEHVVEQFKEILPDASIYVQAVIPVSKAVSDSGKNGVTNPTVQKYNAMLQELSERQQVFYLAIDESFTNEDGCLDSDRSPDGIHMNGDSIREQMRYFRMHTVNNEDYLWEDK